MLDCLVGFDRDDEWTAIARTAPIKRGGSYAAGLDASASAVAKFKIGIVGALFGPESDPSCRAVNVVIKNAISKLSATGTEFIDVEIPDLTHYMTTTPAYVVRSRSDINEFLSTKPHLPQDIALILPREPPHPSMDLTSAVAHGPKDPMSDPTFLKRLLDRDEFQRRVTCLMADYNLDALTFSDVQIPPPRHVESTNGRFPTCWDLPVNTLLASQARLPSITVPVGFTEDGLPVGMEFVSWEYREQDLLELAKGVENCIPARKAPRLELLNSR